MRAVTPAAWATAILIALASTAAVGAAQPPAHVAPGAAPGLAAEPADALNTDPLHCWWRTSAAAVRVGEPFSVVLTCAVVETDAVTVVPNEAELDPNAMQLPPFEIVGGAHPADLRSADHRFFQYEYRVRFVGDDAFGKDVKLPELKISYKVRSRVQGDALEGRDQTYALPAMSVRIMSLVPADATDIRDASLETFGDLDRRTTRANVLRAVGVVLAGFAVLAALLALVRLASGGRRRAPAARALVSDTAILREVGRELAALEHARNDGGWNAALAARLLTALRILGAYALGLPATPLPASAAAVRDDGQMTVRGRGLRGSRVTVPAWVTARVIAQGRERQPAARRAEMLEQLQDALARLTAAQYGHDVPLDDASLTSALELGVSALRQLKIDNIGILKRMRAFRDEKLGLESGAWSP